MRPFRWIPVLLIPLLAAVSAAAAGSGDLAGHWHGFWTAPEGWLYEADVVLAVADGVNVAGPITWTLRKSPRPEEQAKLGLSGVERVQGEFLPEAAVVRLEGWSLEDPNHILGTDKYRLILSDDGRVLGGITWHNGSWTAQILLDKQ